MGVYLELIRPFTLLAPFIGFLSGAVVASRALPDINAVIGASSAVFLNAASNAVNQYFDLGIDRINKPFRPLPSGKITKARTMQLAGILYAAALFLSLLVNVRLFCLVAVTALITFFYSAPPVRLKGILFINNAAIAFARGMLLFVAGWSVFQPVWRLEPWFIGAVFALYLFGAATTKDFSDCPGDREYGMRTLPVVFGPGKAARVIAPFFSVPFLLIPAGIALHLIDGRAWPLTLLFFWGMYTSRLIRLHPVQLTLEKNHVSWKHMYFILLAGQIGLAAAYVLPPAPCR